MARTSRLSARLGDLGGPDRKRSPRRRIVTYMLLIAASVLLLAVSSSSQVQDVRRGINYALSPVQEVLAGGARAVSSIAAAFTEVDQLRKDNRTLTGQVASLQQQVQQLEVLRTENAHLSELLGTRKALKYDSVAAFVVARTPSQFERTITLDRGSEAGIAVGDAVLAPGGALAGVVTEVFDGSASVRLLSDPRSLVIGIAVSTRATGEVKGDFSSPLDFGKVAATETLTEGDTVTTAGTLVQGFKALLPRDLLIGTIVQVMDDPSQFSKAALVQPAADLDRLESVLVITSYEAPHLVDPNATPGPTQAPDASVAPGHTPKPRNPKPTKGP